MASTVVPFRNCTVPVGVPAEEDTVAVNVTGLPTNEGLTEDVSVVVLVALVMVTCTPSELLGPKLESPW